MFFPLLSRSGITNPMGKLVPLPNTRLAQPTLDKLRTLAASEGIPFSEYVRVLLETRAHGTEHVAIVAGERIARIAGTGPTAGPRH